VNNVTIVVGSTDKYWRLWKPLIHGFYKYWPNCPWRKTIITNFLDAPLELESLKTGKDKSWGNNISKGLKQLNTKYIIWVQDDTWITGPVQTDILKLFIDIIEKNGLLHIRLLPSALPDKGVVPERECKKVSQYNSRLWFFKYKAEFRSSITIGIWLRKKFLEFTSVYKTPWEFEKETNKLIYGDNRYLCNNDPYVFPIGWYCNPYPNGKNTTMTRGKWHESAYEYAKYEGLNIDFSVHPNGTPNEEYKK